MADIDPSKTHDRPPDTLAGHPHPDTRTPTRALRFVPPVAALGTAFVLQVVLVTDIGGGVLADRMADTGPTWLWYTLAGLFGLSVASCLEGGAAYLMDLYDRHLLARDSVWLLRLGMVGYVAVSATMVHWWAGQRGLPELVAWVLAGMSASALFLWSRGSRWAQRREMVSAGQLDPALPRLPLASKLFHPFRWIITLYLISWEPVATVDEARERYDQWRTDPHWWSRTPPPKPAPDKPARRRAPSAPAPADTDTGQELDSPLAPVRNIASRTARKRPRQRAADVPVPELARELDRAFPDKLPGVQRAMAHLRGRYGSCGADRAQAAVRTVVGWRDGGQADDGDDQESEAVAA